MCSVECVFARRLANCFVNGIVQINNPSGIAHIWRTALRRNTTAVRLLFKYFGRNLESHEGYEREVYFFSCLTEAGFTTPLGKMNEALQPEHRERILFAAEVEKANVQIEYTKRAGESRWRTQNRAHVQCLTCRRQTAQGITCPTPHPLRRHSRDIFVACVPSKSGNA